ncbi:hypothetical protein BST61_g11465 [Cercospora zeina]
MGDDYDNHDEQSDDEFDDSSSGSSYSYISSPEPEEVSAEAEEKRRLRLELDAAEKRRQLARQQDGMIREAQPGQPREWDSARSYGYSQKRQRDDRFVKEWQQLARQQCEQEDDERYATAILHFLPTCGDTFKRRKTDALECTEVQEQAY